MDIPLPFKTMYDFRAPIASGHILLHSALSGCLPHPFRSWMDFLPLTLRRSDHTAISNMFDIAGGRNHFCTEFLTNFRPPSVPFATFPVLSGVGPKSSVKLADDVTNQ